MKLVAFSSNRKGREEVGVVIGMFREGLKSFHLRKPSFSRREMENYLKAIPPRYRKHVILHSYHELALKYQLKGIHLSRKHRKKKWNRLRLFWFRLRHPDLVITRTCHQLSELLYEERKYDYVFLSPVFEGISSKSHTGGFSERTLTAILQKTPYEVFALGGVEPDNLKKVAEIGFDGAAFAGTIWKSDDDKTEKIRKGLNRCQELTRQEEGMGSEETREDHPATA